MIFDTDLWGVVQNRYPLRPDEVAQLEHMIEDSAKVAHALVMWGLALQQGYASSYQEPLFIPSMGW